MLVTVIFVALPFMVLAFELFITPSMNIVQFRVVSTLSVPVKLKLIVLLLNAVCATGELSVTAGATVSFNCKIPNKLNELRFVTASALPPVSNVALTLLHCAEELNFHNWKRLSEYPFVTSESCQCHAKLVKVILLVMFVILRNLFPKEG